MGIDLFHISLYTVGLVMCLTCLLFTFVQKRTKKVQNKLYIATVLILSSNAVTEIICEVCEPFKQSSGAVFIVLRLSEFLYFVLHTALSPVFTVYVLCVCGANAKTRTRQESFKMSSLFLVSELLVITNPLTGWVYHFDGERNFTRGWAEMVIYLTAAVYLLYSVYKLFFSWRALTGKRRIALVYFYLLALVGVAIQFINIDIKSEIFAEALALTGVMIAIETEDDRIDIDTGIYNRKALSTDAGGLVVNDRVFTVVCLKITNGDLIQRATGSENLDKISASISEELRRIMPGYEMYSTSPFNYILLMPDKVEEQAAVFAHEISERFEKTWKLGDTDILLNAVVMTADAPDRIKSVNDVFYMADSPVPPGIEKKVLMGSDLDYLMRRLAVEGAISRGLEKHYFEVYYQPTYYLVDKRIHGAEALIRLHDNELGNVYPDEFIPIAEQIGLISTIDDYVLHEVCAFIKTGILERTGLDCINVNLSVTECMQPGFIDRINRVVEEYGIDKHSINFEITESIDANDYDRLNEVVTQLKDAGFRFSMDDYGTGYSNIKAIFSLDFDVIKIDKSILWSAEESELGRIILENSVRMIRQMKREILVEGVETQQQLELLTQLSVDYLQGYYFSRPIPKNEFINLVEHGSKTV
ncbi:MAG: EAL domain-containing protein [Ruminococcus sp.]|nr:EAL domain-containing protein [Ruminococcus sp.]